MDQNGKIQASIQRIGNLFYLDDMSKYYQAVVEHSKEIDKCHSCLGHLNYKDLSNMIKNQNVTGILIQGRGILDFSQENLD